MSIRISELTTKNIFLKRSTTSCSVVAIERRITRDDSVSKSENAAFHQSAEQSGVSLALALTHIYLLFHCKMSLASGKITDGVERAVPTVHCYSRISAANAPDKRRAETAGMLRTPFHLRVARPHIPVHGRRFSMDYKLPVVRELWPVRVRRLLVRLARFTTPLLR